MICPAMECCCGEELLELTECTFEATFETCSIDCPLATEDAIDGNGIGGNNDEQNGVRSSASRIRAAFWIFDAIPGAYMLIGFGWVSAWSI
mmetsp:Transcript_44398/g.135345  ORF Transcript_44398/g.135345 Transcript_44398/m.135345 type:complete len:91 (-) Transcript_44398:122-394(-)